MSDLAATERALMTALNTIREHWDTLLTPTSSGGVASKPAPRSLYTRHDTDERDDDLPNLDRRIALRHDVTQALNSWARLIVEECEVAPWIRCSHGATVTLRWPKVGPTRVTCARRIGWAKDGEGVEQSGLHAILGTDTIGLVEFLERWARWFSGHEAAQDASDELTVWAGRVRATATPQRRDWIALGPCPLEHDFGDGPADCGGQVRAHTGRDPQCQRCGTTAVAAWWERVMFPDAETSRLVTADEIVTLLHREFGQVVKPGTVRVWLSRGVIEHSGIDDKGRRLYDKGAVVYAYAKRNAG